MNNFALFNKPLGLTPLQAIELFRSQNSLYKDATLSYAGRLDPMAEGLILILINDENKKREHYQSLDKTYEFTMLLGVSTDSYDLMGKISQINYNFQNKKILTKLKIILPEIQNLSNLPYPPFSSKSINGKPLFWYARNNKLNTIKIPFKKIEISQLLLTSTSLLARVNLLNRIHTIIPTINGNFRQSEIISNWEDIESLLPDKLPMVSFKIKCSSGTYIRGIVNVIGKKLDIPTLTFSIKRTSIGNFKLK